MGDAHEDFIFERRRRNVSYRKIAQQLIESEEFPELKSVDHTTVFEFFKNRLDRYQADLQNLKSVRSANAKCRLSELEEVKDTCKEKLLEVIGLSPNQWENLSISFLLSQFVNLMDQIRTECGDKAKDKNGEKSGQTSIHIHNHIPGVLAGVTSTSQGYTNRISRN